MPLDIEPIVTEVTVHYEFNGEHHMAFGYFMSENDEWVTIEGTVGSHIRQKMHFPKARILWIEQ